VADSPIRERSGVAFLVDAPPATGSGKAPLAETTVGSAQATTSASDAVATSSRILAGKTILLSLTQLGANEHPVNLRDVAAAVHARADILLPLTDRFVDLGFIRIVNETAFGDNDVELTDVGKTWAQESDRLLFTKLAEL
jgi:hypothetical protein